MKNSKKEEKKNNKKIKTGIIFASISAFILTLVLVLLIPICQYQKGCRQIANGEYGSAVTTLEGNFFSSAKRKQEFAKGCICFQDGDYNEGIEHVINAGGSLHVTYDPNGGNTRTTSEDITSNKKIRLSPSKEGYTFIDWSLVDFNVNAQNTSIDFSLFANYAQNKYTLSLDFNNYTGTTASFDVYYDSEYSLPISTKNHFGEGKWYTNNNIHIPTTGIWKYTDITSLKAKFERETIEFGSYPQNRIEDENIVLALNQLAGSEPTKEDFGNWTSYRYHSLSEEADYMFYIDLTYLGKKYRGVYLFTMKPVATNYDAYFSCSNNHYPFYTAIWFEYSPIIWEILETNDGILTLFSKHTIDFQPYEISYVDKTSSLGYDVNNIYSTSNIRKWLNSKFYDTAFTETDKNSILTTEVDNSINSTLSTENFYTCENTFDKVYLLSEKDFAVNYFNDGQYSEELDSKYTNYAYSQESGTNGELLTRTPSSINKRCVKLLWPHNNRFGDSWACHNSTGVRPVIKIRLG